MDPSKRRLILKIHLYPTTCCPTEWVLVLLNSNVWISEAVVSLHWAHFMAMVKEVLKDCLRLWVTYEKEKFLYCLGVNCLEKAAGCMLVIVGTMTIWAWIRLGNMADNHEEKSNGLECDQLVVIGTRAFLKTRFRVIITRSRWWEVLTSRIGSKLFYIYSDRFGKSIVGEGRQDVFFFE